MFIHNGASWDSSLDLCFCFTLFESPEERTEDYNYDQWDISVTGGHQGIPHTLMHKCSPVPWSDSSGHAGLECLVLTHVPY